MLISLSDVSWRDVRAQDVSRLHRDHHARPAREVIGYDYIDVTTLARMALKRQTG